MEIYRKEITLSVKAEIFAESSTHENDKKCSHPFKLQDCKAFVLQLKILPFKRLHEKISH